MTAHQQVLEEPRLVKLTVDDFLRLNEAGAFDRYGKTELIEGVIYQMSPQYRPHGFIKDEIAYRLRRALETLGSSLYVATEQSIEVAEHNEPQPDIIMTAEPKGRGPIPLDTIALIVEVGGPTLRFDLSTKATVYAAAGVPEYWVADVDGRVFHRMWLPGGESYAERDTVPFGAALAMATMPEIAIDTAGL